MDTERMERVLRRVYGGELPQFPEKHPEERLEALLRGEMNGERLLAGLSTKSPACAGELRRYRQRSEARLRSLQSEYFLQKGNTCAGKRAEGKRNQGILTLLRTTAHHYRTLAVGYTEAGFPRFASEAGETAAQCENLLRRIMQK